MDASGRTIEVNDSEAGASGGTSSVSRKADTSLSLHSKKRSQELLLFNLTAAKPMPPGPRAERPSACGILRSLVM